MKVIFLIALLVCFSGCATKLRVPLNRMVTPESGGGSMNPQFDLSTQQMAEGKVDLNSTEPYKLDFNSQAAMNYFAALSVFETVDITWNHTASAPSIVSFKWQFLGGSLAQAGAGHSMAITAGFGGNDHEIEGDTKVEFSANAQDFSVIHGYWFTPNWQIFETLGYSKYSFAGKLSGANTGDFKDDGKLITLAAGTALVMNPYRLKAEIAYTKADWSESGATNYLAFAFGIGLFF